MLLWMKYIPKWTLLTNCNQGNDSIWSRPILSILRMNTYYMCGFPKHEWGRALKSWQNPTPFGEKNTIWKSKGKRMNFRAQKWDQNRLCGKSAHFIKKKKDYMKRKLPEMQGFPKSPYLDPATYAQRHQQITFFWLVTAEWTYNTAYS